ncbi:MAG: metallophosphoesterase [Methanoregulaceae archaeon]|nr:metallophosphoesterase [Methanoregulaceae archaeon]
MMIGLLGDTHDNLTRIGQAVVLLNNEAAGGMFLHTGDFIAPFVIPALARLEGKVIGVYGNNDGDHELLQVRCAETENVRIEGNFYEFTVDGTRIALLHGHERALLPDLIESELFDLVVHGHSHWAGISRKGRTLVINPGEVCGYLTGKPSCACYDTEADEARIIPLSSKSVMGR